MRASLLLATTAACAATPPARSPGPPPAAAPPGAVASAPTVRALVAGSSHACVLSSDGAVFCFGDNAFGQVGAGAVRAVPAPYRVALAGPAIDVTAGARHTCAALADGALWCWGERHGDTPQRVEVPAPIDRVVTEILQPCVRTRADRIVWCLGGPFGPYGESPTEWRSTSSPATELGQLPSCAGGGSRAITVVGGRPYFVYNAVGAAPSGAARLDEQRRPVDAEGRVLCRYERETRVDVAATAARLHARGEAFSCAVDHAGVLRCEGDNHRGQLGRGTVRQLEAAPIPGLVVTRLAVSSRGVCGVTAEGGLLCADNRERRAVEVALPARAVDVALTGATRHVVTDRGTVLVDRQEKTLDLSRSNFVAAIGTGRDQVIRALPSMTHHALFALRDHRVVHLDVLDGPRLIDLVVEAGLPPIRRIADVVTSQVVDGQCLRELGADQVRCFDRVGTKAKELSAPAVPSSAQLVRGAGTYCSRSVAGDVHCWSRDEPPRRIPLPGPALALDGSDHLLCASVAPAGEVLCWGTDPLRTATDDAAAPTPLRGLSGIVELSVASDEAVRGTADSPGPTRRSTVCGRDAAGQVSCAFDDVVREPAAPVQLPAS